MNFTICIANGATVWAAVSAGFGDGVALVAFFKGCVGDEVSAHHVIGAFTGSGAATVFAVVVAGLRRVDDAIAATWGIALQSAKQCRVTP